MSAQANIVAFDGAATPVIHTLVPIGAARLADGTLQADWAERITTLPLNAQVSCSTRKRTLKSGMEQVTLTVKVPVMETAVNANSAGYTAQPLVAFEDTIVISGYFSKRSTSASRKLIRQLAINVFGSVATTVTPIVTGVAPELFDSSISAS